MGKFLNVMSTLTIVLGSGCTCDRDSRSDGQGQPPVVIVDPDELERPRADPEHEPNDDRSQAQALLAEQWIEAALSPARDRSKDVDYYRIQVEEGDHILSGMLTGVKDLDLVLEAYADDGQRLVRVNNTKEGGGEVLVNLAVAGGRYFLAVREAKGRASTDRYRINYQLRAREEGEELEPNWKAELATPLALDEEVIGYLGWHTDNDWYRVELKDVPKGSRIRVELDGVDGVRATLAVLDGKETLIQQRSEGIGKSIVLPNLVMPATSEHAYIVAKCRYQSNVETRYSLRALTTIPTGPTEAEPNEDPASASPLPLSIPVAGLLADKGDLDLYRITTRPDMPLQIVVVPPIGLDVALALLDHEGAVIWEVDQGKARQPEVMPVVWGKMSSALIRLRAPQSRDVNPDASYIIKATRVEGLDWEHEPNNTMQTATGWDQAQGAVRGFIHPDADIDTYKLVSNGEQVHLRLATAPRMKLNIEMVDQSGKAVVVSKLAEAQGITRLVATTAPGAAYYIKVAETSGSSSSEQAYRISRENP